jgi:hypothetical protein
MSKPKIFLEATVFNFPFADFSKYGSEKQPIMAEK